MRTYKMAIRERKIPQVLKTDDDNQGEENTPGDESIQDDNQEEEITPGDENIQEDNQGEENTQVVKTYTMIIRERKIPRW